MDKKTHVIPFGYLSYNLEDSPLAFGLAVNAPFGLSTDWTNSGIRLADDPNFRAFWYGTNKLFLNGLFFSPFLEAGRGADDAGQE